MTNLQYLSYMFQIKALAKQGLKYSKEESALLKFEAIALRAEKILKAQKLNQFEKNFKNLSLNKPPSP